MKWDIKDLKERYNYTKWLLLLLVLWIVISIVSVYFTQFTKTITIKEKYVKPGKKGRFRIIDTNGENYEIVDNLFLLEFDSADDYGNIQVGSTYIVHGYWFRVPIFSWFPRIYKVKDRSSK
jgi:hypothetical protein